MATLTIRNLSDDVRDMLRRRAAENGRSMEAEARATLSEKYQAPSKEVSLEEIEMRIKKAQEIAAKYLPNDGRSLVDDFLAERRAMWGED